MQFCLGVIPKTATGCHWKLHWIIFYAFLSQIYQFLSQYYIYNKITTKYGILRLRPFQRYVFCQIIKSLILKDRNTIL